MGTIHTRGANRPYPRGFWKAWAVGSSGLENFLEINARGGDDRGRVGLGLLSMVGFPDLDTWQEPVDLTVYAVPDDIPVNVPTFAEWFHLFEQRWPALSRFPEDAQRDLVRAYSTLETDPVGAFESVTGCSRSALLEGAPVSRDIGCSETFIETLEALGPSPYGRGTTASCLRRYAKSYRGPRDAASLRAFLLRCEDAGFLYSGVGWTYNTYANPMLCGSAADQGIRERYTEREFIVDNVPFTRMAAFTQIPLDLRAPSDRAFLEDGYCS